MNDVETRLLNILKDLKENYFVKSVKLEFEAEGTTYKEAQILKDITEKANLELTVKIGGCEAVRDLNDVKILNAGSIVAPMVESDYALKKFIKAIEKVELKNKDIYINIESVGGYENLEKIVNSKEFEKIGGIILGRTDMAGSLGLEKNGVNSDTVFEIAKNISQKMKNMNKKFVVGGGIRANSVSFLKNISYLTNFETRKIIYDSEILNTDKAQTGIQKGLEFEIEWLTFKKNNFDFYSEDEIRLKELENMVNLKN